MATIFGPGDHQGEVEGDNLLVAQDFRHVTRGNFLGEAFDNRGLTDPGLTDEDRVIFRPAAENLDDPLNLAFAADDWVKATVAGYFGQITTECFESRGFGFRLALGAGCLGLAFVGEGAVAVFGLVVVIIVLIVGREIRINFSENFVASPLDVHVQTLEDAGCNTFPFAQ